MLKLQNAEWYRLRKSWSTLALLLAGVVTMLFILGTSLYFFEPGEDIAMKFMQGVGNFLPLAAIFLPVFATTIIHKKKAVHLQIQSRGTNKAAIFFNDTLTAVEMEILFAWIWVAVTFLITYGLTLYQTAPTQVGTLVNEFLKNSAYLTVLLLPATFFMNFLLTLWDKAAIGIYFVFGFFMPQILSNFRHYTLFRVISDLSLVNYVARPYQKGVFTETWFVPMMIFHVALLVIAFLSYNRKEL